ncbi:MAG: transcription antitermination factor NusB, partial [Candidatus Sumerlaeota bacterium]
MQSLRTPESPGFDALLDDARRISTMSGPDVALARQIAFGVVRQRRWLEEVLARYLHKPLPTQAHQVRDALLIGVYQALYLDRIPAHTIVDESVNLVASVRTEVGYRSLTNAIMRKVVSAPREEVLPPKDASWPLLYSIPDWLSSEAGQVYKGDELISFFAASNAQAPLCLRATALVEGKTDDDLLVALKQEIVSYIHADAEVGLGTIPRSFLVSGRGIAPDHLPSFRAGHFTVEDEGAQIVSYLAGAREGDAVLDLCASPGGKTSNIADIGARKFARFVACDVSEQKLLRLRDTLKRLHLTDTIEVRLVEDALRGEKQESFDVVLVDAPCSALGTMRRHPEVRWKRSARDLRMTA